jgi:uncharacterized protein
MESTPFPEFDEAFTKELAQDINQSQKRPFTVSIMGQTGVGKTSLLKALFNKVLFDKNILVDHVRPATKNPETYKVTGENGQVLIINDLPGIGESNHADQNHLDTYQKYFLPSDLVLWAIQADSRSTTLDAQALGHLLGNLDEQEQEQFMSKIVFVLTKVDTLLPTPWIMEYVCPSVWFLPGEETRSLIEKKQDFFQEQLIQPFGSHIVSLTYNDVNFSLEELFFSDENQIMYRGLLTKKLVVELSEAYPQYKNVFNRLYDNYCPVACSAHFKYNLSRLILVILNKIGSDAVQNFKRVVDTDLLKIMSLDEARSLCNILVWNTRDSRKILDLEDGKFPDPKRDSVFYKKKVEQPNKKPEHANRGWFRRKK